MRHISFLKPMGYNWSHMACRIGHLVPIWQPLIGSSFQLHMDFVRERHLVPVPFSAELDRHMLTT
jgi:hypothetical protein